MKTFFSLLALLFMGFGTALNAQLFLESPYIILPNDPSPGGSLPYSVHAADLDGDGDMDALSALGGDNQIVWFENLGEGTFSSKINLSSDGSCSGAQDAQAADIDGDGDLDVVYACGAQSDQWIINVGWYENLGDGEFAEAVVVADPILGASSVAAADMDNDGDIDVVWSSHTTNTVGWNENFGGGNFSAPSILTNSLMGVQSVRVIDLDNDGDTDVISSSYDDDKVVWFENIGEGNFSGELLIADEINGASSLDAEDLDEDGDFDVLIASHLSPYLSWVENLGGGEFSAPVALSSNFDSNAVMASDLDADGDLDIVACSAGTSDKVFWHENLGEGSFSEEVIISTSANDSYDLYAADMDGDGDVDVLCSSLADHQIVWYENLSPIYDCTDPEACNFNPLATDNDESCNYGICLEDADGNQDGVIDAIDLTWILSQFGCTGMDCDGDLNGDGIVNIQDLILFFGFFGQP